MSNSTSHKSASSPEAAPPPRPPPPTLPEPGPPAVPTIQLPIGAWSEFALTRVCVTFADRVLDHPRGLALVGAAFQRALKLHCADVLGNCNFTISGSGARAEIAVSAPAPRVRIVGTVLRVHIGPKCFDGVVSVRNEPRTPVSILFRGLLPVRFADPDRDALFAGLSSLFAGRVAVNNLFVTTEHMISSPESTPSTVHGRLGRLEVSGLVCEGFVPSAADFTDLNVSFGTERNCIRLSLERVLVGTKRLHLACSPASGFSRNANPKPVASLSRSAAPRPMPAAPRPTTAAPRPNPAPRRTRRGRDSFVLPPAHRPSTSPPFGDAPGVPLSTTTPAAVNDDQSPAVDAQPGPNGIRRLYSEVVAGSHRDTADVPPASVLVSSPDTARLARDRRRSPSPLVSDASASEEPCAPAATDPSAVLPSQPLSTAAPAGLPQSTSSASSRQRSRSPTRRLVPTVSTLPTIFSPEALSAASRFVADAVDAGARPSARTRYRQTQIVTRSRSRSGSADE